MPDRLETAQSVEPDLMVIDNPGPSHDDPAQLSSQLLQTGAANRQVERDLLLRLLKSARLMLQYEQQCMQRGGHEDGQNLIHELTGEQKDLFPLFSTDTSNW